MKNLSKKTALYFASAIAGLLILIFTSSATAYAVKIKAPSVSTSKTTTTVTLSWNGVENARLYSVARYESKSKTSYPLWYGTASSYIVDNLSPGTLYTFYVTAYDEDWGEARSSYIYVTTEKTTPASSGSTYVAPPSGYFDSLRKSLYYKIKNGEHKDTLEVNLSISESVISKGVFEELKKKESVLVVHYGNNSYLFDGADEDFEPKTVDFRYIADNEAREKIKSSEDGSEIEIKMDKFKYIISSRTLVSLVEKGSVLTVHYGKYTYTFDGKKLTETAEIDVKKLAHESAKEDAQEEARKKYKAYKY